MSIRLQRPALSQLLMLLVILAASPAAADQRTVVVRAGDFDRQETPVSVSVPDAWRSHRGFTLTRSDTGDEIPCQVTSGDRQRLVWILAERLAAGQSRHYRLSPATKSPAAKSVGIQQDAKAVRVTVRGKPVLVYNTAVVRAADRKEAYYDRSGYLHPLYNPSGQVVTDDFAPDHPHQHGLMFPWTNTTFEGRSINFWDQKNGQGTVNHESIEGLREGPVFAELKARLGHLDITTPDRPRRVLQETWQVRVYNLKDYFLFDLRSSQLCVGSPLRVNEYHYGGLAIRGHRNWLTPGQGDFLTSDGKTRADGNQTRPRWCDIHGKIDGAQTGIMILCHPENFRAPQPVRLHPNKPYFCFAPLALGGFTIEPGTPFVSRYRFCIHDGPLDSMVAERLWNDLADPPRVDIE